MIGLTVNETDRVERIGSTIGKVWKIEELLGRGATAAVYRAANAQGQRVAIKILHPEMAQNAEVRERFSQEAEIAKRLIHPNIVRVFDHDESNPEHIYLTMELLEGESLEARVQRLGSVPLDDLLKIADEVLDALAVAHEQNIVHRDLKQANLFLTKDGGVKVLDFGLARVRDALQRELRTRTGLIVGTIPYMAPEQALGKRHEIDGRTDLFALGVILFRTLSGRRIHEHERPADLLTAMATLPAPPFASVCPDYPAELCGIIDLALAFSKDARYPDARTMQADVRALREGRPPASALGARRREQPTILPDKEAPASDLGSKEQDAASASGFAEGQGGSTKHSLIGTIVAERYRLDALLGEGGMGAVYRAEHVLMRKPVAVKILHREMTLLPEVVARFEREAVAAARIDHPNVAAATDFGRLEDGSFFLVLEYVEGESLRDVMKAGPLEPERALQIAKQIAAALRAAHRADIVHRDLKPENVMLQQRPRRELVKVLDFGIAKVTGESLRGGTHLTRAGSVFGTPHYMAPEQVMGQSVDHRADLYALGVLIYEMLSGTTPFADASVTQVFTKQLTSEAPLLPEHFDQSLRLLVSKLLSKHAAERFQTAEELIAELDVLLPEPARGKMASSSLPHSVSASNLATSPTLLGQEVPGSRLTGDGVPATPRRASGGFVAFATRKVRVMGSRLPVWGLLSAGLALLLGLGTAVSWGDEKPQVVRSLEIKSNPSPELRTRLLEAAAGSTQAIDYLLDEKLKRNADAQFALGMGLMKLGRTVDGLEAYEWAVKLDPARAGKQPLLHDVKVAAATQATSARALELSASLLGQHGADLIYELAHDQDADEAARLRAEKLLSSSKLRRHFSPALRVLVDLDQAKSCKDFQRLLPKAKAVADHRAVPTLERLTETTGCGFLWLSDCYPCLKDRGDVNKALEAVKKRAEASSS